MNKIYRLKFSKRLNQLVAVSEITAGHDRHSGCQNAVDTTSNFQMTKWLKLKPLASLISLLSFGFATQTAMANGLQGMEVVNGTASMSINGKSTTITNSPNAIINWKQFNINQDELVRFVQENSNSAVFNRVTSDQISQLKGALNSNGQVFLINPNGIVMGKDAVINAAAFTASTLNILDEDLKARNFNFEQAKDKAMAQIVNNGLISVSKNGSVNLIGGSVKNNGVIKVEDGNILLLAGQKVTISDMTNPTITYSVVAPENKAVNLGTIFAKNGKIQVHAGSLVNKGTLNANSVRQDKSGEIILSAKEGEANIDGTVTLNNANFKAGSLTITGKKVVLNSGAKVELTGKEGGTVYIGGDERGKGEIQLAKTTKIKQGASVNVSGSEKGGRAIVWGDFAQVDGEIIANGKNKENGGFVETSGHYLGVSNTAKVEAKNWLLDPYNVRIVAPNGIKESNTVSTTSPDTTIQATGQDAVIYNTTITNALNTGTNVTITTDDTNQNTKGTQLGNLTVEANIIKTTGKDATLTLIANGQFEQKNGTKIASTDGKLNVNITSGHGLVLKGEIDTNGGDLNINASSLTKPKGRRSNPNPNFLIENAVLKGKGTVRISGSADYLYNFNGKQVYNKLVIKNTEFEGYGDEGLKLEYKAVHRDWFDGKYEFFSSWEGNITTRGKVAFERKVTDPTSGNLSFSTHNWRAHLKVKNTSRFEFLDKESKLGYASAYNKYSDYKLVNIDEDVTFETGEGSSATFTLKPYLGNGSRGNNKPRGLSVSANITAKGSGHVTFDANANGYDVAGMSFDTRNNSKPTTIKTEGTTTLEFTGKSASRDGLAIKNQLVLDAGEGSHIILNGSSGRAAVNVSASADVTIKGDGETSIKSTSGNVEVNANIKSDSSTVNITSEKNINIKENVEVKGKSVNLEAAEHLTLGNQAKVTATMGDAILSGKNITNSGTVNAKVGNVNVNAKENFTNESTGKLDAKGKVTVDAETVDNKGVIDGHKATSVTAGQKVTNHESGQILSTEGDVYVITNGILHNNGYIQGKTGTTIVEGQRQSKDNLMSDLIHTLGDIQRTVRSSLRAAENEQHPSSSAKSLMFYDKGRAVNKVASIISHGSVCSVELPAGKNIADGRLLTSCLAENEKSKAEYHKQSEKVGD
ncbi:HMW2A, high molecular weight adhesin 2 [Haemophilus influenzae F3031]|uniref:two-partner secretion domain-containing protein n=1 Tax=Haemophilus influenzae TaxID=727 RepID=UPI0001F36A37|nr:filamentous hemagglutinin N-terminal domain-containing protein [Haemophilus influenzae]QEQ64984.1 filamentous hemagglutinin N-terminal domain-containing protein [Haemophilus influenzae biotype aegyptius]CBY80875.1 HMW2A, high molecular weight adhesin 2 [Haemophilus influenzae F3031]